MRDALRELEVFFGNMLSSAFVGKVKETDKAESQAVITVERDGMQYDVKLKSIIDKAGSHMVAIPKKESFVFCVSEGNSKERYLAVALNEVEKVIYKGENIAFRLDDPAKTVALEVGDVSVKMDGKKVVFNDQANDSYLTNINSLVKRINALEEDLNTVKNAFKTWTPAPFDGGGALKAITAQWFVEAFVKTTVEDLKDDKVQH
ncbi:hypothetical protein FUAX_32950 [Fulvitalea axinellae]|uniref:Uncharacterized protein n=1 Tax=Fulvitalea axinellae TaxID=1182444 RepID=A0AAU9CRX7_9BACT|nr:hypothetical protein FUAX_32950 [Fulvitalea axinellae]